MDTREYLIGIMGNYTSDKTIISPQEFEEKIKNIINLKSWSMEGYKEYEYKEQRELSVNYRWGHNHDFGSFKLDGIMGNRHLDIIQSFIDNFDLPLDLSGKMVLDVGAWCGGTTMLLAGMGARVVAAEEVRKYANTIQFLSRMFGRRNTSHNPQEWKNGEFYIDKNYSVYNLTRNDFYDYIIFPGVLYHLSDPLVALRILFNSLKNGGELYIETAVTKNLCRDCNTKPELQFWKGEGNNWFLPNFWALREMLYSVGFYEVSEIFENNERAICKATRKTWKPMLKAGLSRKIR